MRRNDTDCFAKFNELARSEIASIAHRTHASAALAGKNRTNLQAFHAYPLKLRGDLFVDQLIRLYDLFPFVHRVGDRFATDATNDPLRKIDNFLIALVNRAHNNSIHSSTIFCIDDHILRRVHQLASKVTRVRRLECRVGKPLARTVRGDEVLEYAKALAEVRRDWALDDFAARLGH